MAVSRCCRPGPPQLPYGHIYISHTHTLHITTRISCPPFSRAFLLLSVVFLSTFSSYSPSRSIYYHLSASHVLLVILHRALSSNHISALELHTMILVPIHNVANVSSQTFGAWEKLRRIRCRPVASKHQFNHARKLPRMPVVRVALMTISRYAGKKLPPAVSFRLLNWLHVARPGGLAEARTMNSLPNGSPSR